MRVTKSVKKKSWKIEWCLGILFLLFFICKSNIHAAGVTENMTAQQNADIVVSQEDIATETEDTPSEEVKAEELDLGEYETTMQVGDTQLLSVTVLPNDTTNQTITYQSKNEKIAKINGMGRITAKSPGTTRITVTCGKVKESFKITVEKVVEEKEIPVTDIEISDYEEELEVDSTMSITASVIPADAKESTITYISDNTAVATVNSGGEVRGIAPGKVTITAMAGNISRDISLTVKVATTAIQLNSTYVILQESETYQIQGRVQPKEAYQNLSYKSEDTTVADVSSDGVITANEEGSTTVLVSNGDLSNAVTVIVNTNTATLDKEKEISSKEETSEQKTQSQTFVGEMKKGNIIWIDSEVIGELTKDELKYLYTQKEKVCINGTDYCLILDGKDIVNYENELLTTLECKVNEIGKELILNKGNSLPGKVTLQIDDISDYKYMYLYNSVKDTYERIQNEDMQEITVSTAGKYLLTNKLLDKSMVVWCYLVAFGGIIVILSVVYIVIKKKYWFW